VLPFKQSERLRDVLTAAGMQVRWVPFAGGHAIPGPVLEQLTRFTADVLGGAPQP
jgi:phospholipase/carboxylesterase